MRVSIELIQERDDAYRVCGFTAVYLTEDLKGALEYEKEVRDHSGVHCSFGNTYLCLPWRVW